MKVIYIAGPLIAADHYKIRLNIDRAAALGLEVAKLGACPVIPHTNTGAWFIETISPEFWYAATMELLRRCDAVMTVPGWLLSTGAVGEVAEAERLQKKVFHDLGGLRAWLDPMGRGDDETRADEFPCSGFKGCPNLVYDDGDVCRKCEDRNAERAATGCPGCGGDCQTACR